MRICTCTTGTKGPTINHTNFYRRHTMFICLVCKGLRTIWDRPREDLIYINPDWEKGNAVLRNRFFVSPVDVIHERRKYLAKSQ